MIVDHLRHEALYRGFHPSLTRAFDWLLAFKIETPLGRYPLDGENLFALVQSYETVPASERKFEAHRRYVDLQYIVSGEEIIYHAPVESLRMTVPHDLQEDCALYEGPNEQALLMRAGDFAILFPQDGHKPGCHYRSSSKIEKVVFKMQLASLSGGVHSAGAD